MNTDLGTLAGAVSGTEMQVDIVASLPAGTNNIGDVDVLTMPGTFAEDTVAGDGAFGMHMLAVRADADAASGANGDYVSLHVNSLGELKTTSKLDSTFNSSIVVTKTSVDSTAGGTQLVGSALASRGEITIQNLGAQDMFIRGGTGADANDFKVPKNGSATYSWGDNIDPYGFVSSGTADVRILEAA